MSCGWPFHHDPKCEECKQWESKHGEAITQYMDSLAEIKARQRADRAARRRTTPRGVNASEPPG